MTKLLCQCNSIAWGMHGSSSRGQEEAQSCTPLASGHVCSQARGWACSMRVLMHALEPSGLTSLLTSSALRRREGQHLVLQFLLLQQEAQAHPVLQLPRIQQDFG